MQKSLHGVDMSCCTIPVLNKGRKPGLEMRENRPETVRLAIILELKAAEMGSRCHLRLDTIRDATVAPIDIS